MTQAVRVLADQNVVVTSKLDTFTETVIDTMQSTGRSGSKKGRRAQAARTDREAQEEENDADDEEDPLPMMDRKKKWKLSGQRKPRLADVNAFHVSKTQPWLCLLPDCV